MRLQEFGQKVKTKYPELGHLSDEEAGRMAAEKYPVYKQQIQEYKEQEQAEADRRWDEVEKQRQVRLENQPQPDNRSFLRKVGDAVFSAEKGLGETYGQTAAYLSGAGEDIDRANQTSLETGNKWIRLAQNTNDETKRQEYLNKAQEAYRQAGKNYNEIIPVVNKSNKQIIGESLGTALDIATAGTFGAAAKGAKSFQVMGKAGKVINPAINKTARVASRGMEMLPAGKQTLRGMENFGSALLNNRGVKKIDKWAGDKVNKHIRGIGTPNTFRGGAWQGGKSLGVLGALQGGADAARENKDILSGVIGGGMFGTLTGGLVGGTGAKLSRRVERGLGKGDKLGVQGTLAANINDIVENSAQKTRNIGRVATEQGTDIGELLARRKIVPQVKNDRLFFSPEQINKIDNEIVEKSELLDEAIGVYNTRISAKELAERTIQQIKSNQALSAEGRVQEVSKKALKKIRDFVTQTDQTDFSLLDLHQFKKGMWSASKKFKRTEIGDADAFSELGTVFRKLVEEEVPDAQVKALNQEIGGLEKAISLMKVTEKSGGLVLPGGKIGRYIGDTAASIGGVGVGSLFGGPIGAMVGGVVAPVISGTARNISQKGKVLGMADRVLLGLTKDSTTNKLANETRKFLDDIALGKTVTATPRVQKLIKEYMEKEYGSGGKLLLPAGKTGAPRSSVYGRKVIKLPKKSDSLNQWWER